MRRVAAVLALSALIVMAGTLAPSARAVDPPAVTIYSAFTSSGSSESEAFAAVLARVQGELPGITINDVDIPFGDLYSAYFTDAESGGPDLLIAPNDSLYWEWQAGYALDVHQAVLPARQAMRHEALVGSMVDGHLAQVPEGLKAVGLFYDREELPEPPTTTDAMMAALEAGTKIGIVGWGSEVYYAYGFFGSFGGKIMARDGTCIADRTQGVAMALAWLHDAYATGNLLPYGSWQDAGAAFESGEVSALFEGSWRFADFRNAFGSRLGVVAGPTGPDGDLFRAMVGADGYTVNPFGEEDAALTVALALTDQTSQQTFMDLGGHIPADRTIRVTDPLLRVFEKATRDGVLRPMTAELDAYWASFGPAIWAVLYEDADAATAVADACAAMNEANGK